jgi:hypothetical protein
MRKMPIGLSAFAISWCLWGCQGAPRLAAGVTCSKTTPAGPGAASLTAALSAAKSGECVVAASGRYALALSVPAGVTLAAEVGTTVEVSGAEGSPAVTLANGASLSGIRVLAAPDIGVLIAGGKSKLIDVIVERARNAGVVAWCEEDCRIWEQSALENVELTGNAVGLLVHAAPVKVTGGRVAGNTAVGLAGGYGVVASHGAILEMNGTLVEQNEQLGILVDGALGTQATLQSLTVQGNLGRGVWAQGLMGTGQTPKLQLDDCTIENNVVAGIGARSSSGIQVRGGRIAATKLGKVASSNAGTLVDVGDGIGLFELTANVQVEDVVIDANQRAQVLVDKGSTGLTVARGMITAHAGQMGVVVQNTTAMVQAPMITVPAMGNELPISAPNLALPTR